MRELARLLAAYAGEPTLFAYLYILPLIFPRLGVYR